MGMCMDVCIRMHTQTEPPFNVEYTDTTIHEGIDVWVGVNMVLWEACRGVREGMCKETSMGMSMTVHTDISMHGHSCQVYIF